MELSWSEGPSQIDPSFFADLRTASSRHYDIAGILLIVTESDQRMQLATWVVGEKEGWIIYG